MVLAGVWLVCPALLIDHLCTLHIFLRKQQDQHAYTHSASAHTPHLG